MPHLLHREGNDRSLFRCCPWQSSEMVALVRMLLLVVVACMQALEAAVPLGAILLLWELATCKTEHTRGGSTPTSLLCSSRHRCDFPMLVMMALGLSSAHRCLTLGSRDPWQQHLACPPPGGQHRRLELGVREVRGAVARSARSWHLQKPLNGLMTLLRL